MQMSQIHRLTFIFAPGYPGVTGNEMDDLAVMMEGQAMIHADIISAKRDVDQTEDFIDSIIVKNEGFGGGSWASKK